MTEGCPMSALHPRLDHWFQAQGWTPFGFQEEAWRAFREGHSGLIHVPTGAGKTYAAYLGPLSALLEEGPDVEGAGIRILYISPLRSLSRDLETALVQPLAAQLSAEEPRVPIIRVGVRTADTTAYQRARQRELPPEVLVTTPESLALMLAGPSAPQRFEQLRVVIVDEWHELLSTKRGVQLDLQLARLRRLRPTIQIWGLSATLANLDVAAQMLVGATRPFLLIKAQISKTSRLEILVPPSDLTLPLGGHMGLQLESTVGRRVVAQIQSGQSCLVFTQTRFQCERWFDALRQYCQKAGCGSKVGIHHGSIDARERESIEAGLKSGDMGAVVCTSSLDLGVDFSAVDLIVQIGSPKGVARTLQRAGRSGHRPGATSNVLLVPTHGLELVELVGLRQAVEEGAVEECLPPHQPLDVLVQHVVSCGLGGFVADELLAEIRSSWSYRHLSAEVWEEVLGFCRSGGRSLGEYADYRRLVLSPVDQMHRVATRAIALAHRMSLGTITSQVSLTLRVKNRVLGQIDEYFLSRLGPGQAFIFGGNVYEIVRISDEVALVRSSRKSSPVTARWEGTRLPLSPLLSRQLRRLIQDYRERALNNADQALVGSYLAKQATLSALPAEDETLVECWEDVEASHLFVFPMEGRLVHEGLATLVAFRLGRLLKATFQIAVNDWGFELNTEGVYPFAELWGHPEILTDEGLEGDLMASLRGAEMARRKFRDIAQIAGLIHTRKAYHRRTGRQLQVSAGLLYDTLRRHEPEHLLLRQAEAEVLETHFEKTRLVATLERLRNHKFLWRSIQQPTPFSAPLRGEVEIGQLSTETHPERIARMLQRGGSET